MLHPLAFTCILTIVAMVASYCLGGAYGRAGMAASLIIGLGFFVAFRMQSTNRTYESDSDGVCKKAISNRHETSSCVHGALMQSDPCIYVELIDGRRDLGTPFVLCNRGGGDAHEVQINPISLTVGYTTFKKISVISRGGMKERLPDIESNGVYGNHNFTTVLFHEWMLRTNLMRSDLSVHGTVTYSDSSKNNWFETSFEVIFYPFEENAPSEWGDRVKMVEATTCEIRRLSKSESEQIL